MIPEEAKAEVFWLAFKGLPKKDQHRIVEKLLQDRGFVEDLLDIAIYRAATVRTFPVFGRISGGPRKIRAPHALCSLPEKVGGERTGGFVGGSPPQNHETVAHLEDNPRPYGSKKLWGGERYRIRVGDYRVLYTIDDALRKIEVRAVGHRREVYRTRLRIRRRAGTPALP